MSVTEDIGRRIRLAPASKATCRLSARLRAWDKHYDGQPVVVLDDAQSGTGLRGSRLDRVGCVILCETDVGLHQGHLPAVKNAIGHF